ncbi:MAG: MFS transporter [Imperialibacter sp.]|uniref:MFS transporter n=1 Tax=Imperialibacter sp. TaxID=2038411 RepID=UPI0032ECDDC6
MTLILMDMTDQTSSVILNKTRLRIAVASIFFVHGLNFSSWAARIPDIQLKLGLSEAALGGVLLVLPLGSLASLPFSGVIIDKLGSRLVVLVATLGYALTLPFLGFSSSVAMLSVGLFIYGFFGNTVNIAVNTQAIGVQTHYGRTIMASFHGTWSLAGFTGAGIGTLMVALGVEPQMHYLIMLALVVVILSINYPHTLKEDVNRNTGKFKWVKPDGTLVKIGLIAMCGMMSEGCMFDWSGVYFKKVVEAPEAWVPLGFSAFMMTMAGGRFISDRLTNRFGIGTVLKASGILIASGLLFAVALPYFATALIGFLLVGFGVSSVVPLAYSVAGKSKTMSAGMALTMVSSISFLGFLLGPPLIGFIAEASSLRASFLFIAVIGSLVAVITSMSKTIQRA